MRTDRAPGPLLRLTTAAATVASGLVVVSAALELGRGHWGAALVALPLLVAVLVASVVSYRRLVVPAATAVVSMLAAIATGGLVAWLDTTWAVAIHVAAAGGALAASLVTLVVSFRGETLPFGPWRDYVTLTKPRIMSLLLVTGAGGMFVGARGWPGGRELVSMLLGLALACGGASALNHVLDRDIDRLMGPRPASRPVAAGRISPARAVTFGLLLSAGAFALLAVADNTLAAALAISGGAYYVLVYTVWLKRRTTQNIVIGGAAGAIPALAGWAAARGSLALGAVYLFAIVLVWTPPHFWALALLLAPHYEAAQVPMLPVVRGPAVTARQVLAYTVALTVLTAVPFLTGTFGGVYLVCALGLGGVFCALAVRMWRAPNARRAALLFHYSLLYLALLFVAVALDAAVR